jgi:hypothetical protein
MPDLEITTRSLVLMNRKENWLASEISDWLDMPLNVLNHDR